MLGWRILISAVVIPALIGLFVLDHRLGKEAYWLFGLCILLVFRSCWEMTRLLKTRAFDIDYFTTVGCSLLILGAGWLPHLRESELSLIHEPLASIAIAFTLCVMILFLIQAMKYRTPGRSMETLGAELLTVSYIGLFLTMTSQLRWIAGAQAGYLVLGSLLIAVKCGDTSAYFLGRAFGKKKMTPYLSPGKTWMGGLGAILGAALGSLLWFSFVTPYFGDGWEPPAWYWSILYGTILGVVGIVGDLCESLIKRDVEKKDAAELMPGFGGVLDLLDSVLYTGPMALVLWLLLPLRTW